MGTILQHPPVKPICGILYDAESLLPDVFAALEDAFGPMDFQSEALAFNHTDYYRTEMGDSLTRRFVAFETLMSPEWLPEAKHRTNALERRFLNASGGRRVNLDIGYIAPAKLVLATTKDHGHRIYLANGIFAELEYWYQRGAFTPLAWTFPDYRQEAYRTIFTRIRERYLKQLAALGIPARARPADETHEERMR
jgi:hypothetical protein